MDEIQDVHTGHCCAHPEHGCKYNDSSCTVVCGIARQEYPCEDCDIHSDECQLLQDLVDNFKKMYANLPEALCAIHNLEERMLAESFLHRDPPVQPKKEITGELVLSFDQAVPHAQEYMAGKIQRMSLSEMIYFMKHSNASWNQWTFDQLVDIFADGGIGEWIATKEHVAKVTIREGDRLAVVYDNAQNRQQG